MGRKMRRNPKKKRMKMPLAGRREPQITSGRPDMDTIMAIITDITTDTTAITGDITTDTMAITGDITTDTMAIITDILRDTGLTTSSGPNINGVPMDNTGPDTLIIPTTIGVIMVTGDTATTATTATTGTGDMATTATGAMDGKIGRVLSRPV